MEPPLINAATFLITIVFGLYTFILILRLIFRIIGANFANPLSQFIYKVTQPLLTPLQKFLPAPAGIDLAVILLLFVLEMIKFSLLKFIHFGSWAKPLGLFIISFGDICSQILDVFFYAIFIQIILSWVAPRQYNPITEIIYRITSPIMRPVRRFIPPVGGIDLSPIPVLLLLKLADILLATPLMQMGGALS